jgi:hypothetical protein
VQLDRVAPRITRVVLAMAGLLAVLGSRPDTRAPLVARSLVLSDQARRYLQLQFRSYTTEFMGCMIGEVHGLTVVVQRVAPADVEPAASATTHVVPRASCEAAGWRGTVGIVHSHPSGERCWYFFPSTHVTTSDGQSFLLQPYPVDAIMCGDRLVWVSRDLVEHEVTLVPKAVTEPSTQVRGNRILAGSGK